MQHKFGLEKICYSCFKCNNNIYYIFNHENYLVIFCNLPEGAKNGPLSLFVVSSKKEIIDKVSNNCRYYDKYSETNNGGFKELFEFYKNYFKIDITNLYVSDVLNRNEIFSLFSEKLKLYCINNLDIINSIKKCF